MIKFKKSDLLFLSKLDLKLELAAIHCIDKNNRRYWELHIKAENKGVIQTGILYGARGEVRKFYQLNALVDTCLSYLNDCNELTVRLKCLN